MRWTKLSPDIYFNRLLTALNPLSPSVDSAAQFALGFTSVLSLFLKGPFGNFNVNKLTDCSFNTGVLLVLFWSYDHLNKILTFNCKLWRTGNIWDLNTFSYKFSVFFFKAILGSMQSCNDSRFFLGLFLCDNEAFCRNCVSPAVIIHTYCSLTLPLSLPLW